MFLITLFWKFKNFFFKKFLIKNWNQKKIFEYIIQLKNINIIIKKIIIIEKAVRSILEP
jgi:hypothetical protein